jgi:hypothetical protein
LPKKEELLRKMFPRFRQSLLLAFGLIIFLNTVSVFAQDSAQQQQPISSEELVRLVYQLPKHPEQRDELVEEIRKRGIGFALTDGMRSLVSNKSGSDPILRRTLEEAERRRANPKTVTLPTEAEANELLRLTKNVTLAASGAMPDFIVRQLIKRSVAFGNTSNWIPQDTLTIGVSYRAASGEEYKVLTVNGMPPGPEAKAGSEYGDTVGGASSTGEYVTGLANLFGEEAHTVFKAVDTDLLRGQRTIVYEYEVDLPYSSLVLKADKATSARVASRGRVWIDREQYRVLRFEQIAVQIPGDFPIRAASSLIDYDWVKINERPYLLPSHAEILITSLYKDRQLVQSRNDIRFRGYQKFGAEVKIYDEVDDEVPLEKPEPEKPKKPDHP